MVVLAFAPRLASANWTYKWWYTGQTCAGNTLGVHGYGGSFATQSACEAARASDPHNALAAQSGCLANVDFCFEGDADASSWSSTGRTVVAGITRFYGGVPFGAVSSGTAVASQGGGLGGIELARGGYSQHHVYLFMDIAGAETEIKDKTGATNAVSQYALVLGPELQIGDGRITGIIQIGAGLVAAGYENASNDFFGVKGMAGLDLSLSNSVGLFVFGAGIATPSIPGTMFAGIALELRSQGLLNMRAQ